MHQPAQPFLIAFVGVIGSGKTHIAKILTQKLGAIRITTDEVRVALRRRGQSFGRAPAITRKLASGELARGRSVILDFDAVNPSRQREIMELARKFGARFFVIRVEAPKRLILERLRKKRYTPSDLFRGADQAIRAHIERRAFRKKFHGKRQAGRGRGDFEPTFTIWNDRPLGAQIQKIVNGITNVGT